MLDYIFKKLVRKRAKSKIDRPLIIAHRGARKYTPENTLASFKKAAKLGFDGIELDVVLTRDKVPVVFHGNDLSHSTRETGMIPEMTLSEVKKVDAGSLFDEKFKGETISTLDETLEYLKTTHLFIDVELKGQPRGHHGLEHATGKLIKKHNLEDRVLISSFSPLMLRRFAKKFPEIKTGFLTGPNPFFFLKTLLSANLLRVAAVNPVFQYTSEALVHFATKQEWKVYVWNVNTKQEYKRAIDLGVDGIITDEPELLKLGV